MTGYCPDCGNTACICPEIAVAAHLDREPACRCGHSAEDHWFGCEALPDEGCPCTEVYP